MSSSLTSSDRIEAWRNQTQFSSAGTEPLRGRPLKRAFEMDDRPDLPFREHDTAKTSSSTRSLSPRKRQRLDHPTPPMTTVSQPLSNLQEITPSARDASTDSQYFAAPSVTSRSGSPTRQIQKATLTFTEPSFTLGSGMTLSADITTPDHIRALVRFLEEEACTVGCIPASIFDEVRAISQNMGEVPDRSRSRGDEDEQDQSALLNIVKKVYINADRKFTKNLDENAWYSPVSEILSYGSKMDSPLTIVDAQTKSVCQDLLPRNPRKGNKPIGTVKVDFLLHFNEENDKIKDSLNPWLHKYDGNLSAFNDQSVRSAFSLSVVEVKPAGGDYTDALYQLTVASAAMQQRLIQLQAGGSEDSLQHDYHETLPVVCLAVIGHFWHLHIVYRASRDCIVSQANKVLFFFYINVTF